MPGLVEQCSAKILADSPLLLTQGWLLMMTVSEVLSFDDALALLLQVRRFLCLLLLLCCYSAAATLLLLLLQPPPAAQPSGGEA